MQNHPLLKFLVIVGSAVMVTMTIASFQVRHAGSTVQQPATKASGESKSMQSEKKATVSGTVFYLQRIALPPDATVEVKLVDISRQDVPAVTIAEQKIANPGQVPIPFELRYDPDKIGPRYTYAVQARIEQGGKLLFISTQVFPVITRGNPNHVEIRVDPVR